MQSQVAPGSSIVNNAPGALQPNYFSAPPTLPPNNPPLVTLNPPQNLVQVPAANNPPQIPPGQPNPPVQQQPPAPVQPVAPVVPNQNLIANPQVIYYPMRTREDFARMVPPAREPIWIWATGIKDTLELAGYTSPYPADLTGIMVPLIGEAVGVDLKSYLKGRTLDQVLDYLVQYDYMPQSLLRYLKSVGSLKGRPSAVFEILKQRIQQLRPKMPADAVKILAWEMLREEMSMEIKNNPLVALIGDEGTKEDLNLLDVVYLKSVKIEPQSSNSPMLQYAVQSPQVPPVVAQGLPVETSVPSVVPATPLDKLSMQVDQLQRKMIICENDINRTKSNDNYRYPRTPYWGNGGKFNQAQQKQQLSETTMRTPFNGSIPAPSPSNWQNKTPYNGQKFNNFQNFQNARNNRFPQGNFQINGRGFQTGPTCHHLKMYYDHVFVKLM